MSEEVRQIGCTYKKKGNFLQTYLNFPSEGENLCKGCLGNTLPGIIEQEGMNFIHVDTQQEVHVTKRTTEHGIVVTKNLSAMSKIFAR